MFVTRAPGASIYAPAAVTEGPNQAPAESPAIPEKGVADLLVEAVNLYRAHARSLLTICALLFVPASLAKSCALATISPTLTARYAEQAAEIAGQAETSRRALIDAYAAHADPATITRLQKQHNQQLEEVAQRALAATGGPGTITLWFLSALGTLMTAFFLYGIIVPLTNGALTIAVADRILGGNAGWREVWMLLFGRVGKLLSAAIPAGLLIALGFVCFVIPGFVLVLFFAFLSPVVLVEGLSGRAALRRSVELVRSDWLRVAIMLVVLAVLQMAAKLVARLLTPATAVFFDSLLTDLFTMVLLPVPVLGVALLYFDIRRKARQLHHRPPALRPGCATRLAPRRCVEGCSALGPPRIWKERTRISLRALSPVGQALMLRPDCVAASERIVSLFKPQEAA